MKKSLLALAVLCSLAGSAFAQSSVSIYGIADGGLQREDRGTGSTTGVVSGGHSGSRLGFKGSEDLGGGMAAIFTLENGFNLDTGATADSTRTAFNRQAWVGLSGGAGTVKLGRQHTPMRSALDSIDPFSLGLAGNLERLVSSNGAGFRMDNAVNYATPKMGGFHAQLAYGFGEVAGNSSALRQMGLSTGYANGPINVVLAHNRMNGEEDVGGSDKTTLLGATYDFGVVKAHLGTAWNKVDTTAEGTVGDSRDLIVGVTVPFGSSAIMATYFQRDNKLTADADTNYLALGYTYSLSKRTNLYASYGRESNDALGRIRASANGLDYSVLNAGVRHRF